MLNNFVYDMIFFVFKCYSYFKVPEHYINRKMQYSTASTAVCHCQHRFIKTGLLVKTKMKTYIEYSKRENGERYIDRETDSGR